MNSLGRLVLAATLIAAAAGTHAAPITTQGTWWGTDGTDGTLRARDSNGNAVALNSASAAFFYDATLNITWLANMNAGAGSAFDDGPSSTDGRMTWDSAMNWAASLNAGSGFGGFTDWRLPTVSPVNGTAFQTSFSNNGSTDLGYAKTGTGWGTASEWGHLHYVTLGNLGACRPNDASPVSCANQTGWGLNNTAYFQNMQSFGYWFGTEFAPVPSSAWGFYTADGLQGGIDKSIGLYAVAVRSGDVLRDGGTVPEPQSLALALTALAGLGLALRRRRAA